MGLLVPTLGMGMHTEMIRVRVLPRHGRFPNHPRSSQSSILIIRLFQWQGKNRHSFIAFDLSSFAYHAIPKKTAFVVVAVPGRVAEGVGLRCKPPCGRGVGVAFAVARRVLDPVAPVRVAEKTRNQPFDAKFYRRLPARGIRFAEHGPGGNGRGRPDPAFVYDPGRSASMAEQDYTTVMPFERGAIDLPNRKCDNPVELKVPILFF